MRPVYGDAGLQTFLDYTQGDIGKLDEEPEPTFVKLPTPEDEAVSIAETGFEPQFETAVAESTLPMQDVPTIFEELDKAIPLLTREYLEQLPRKKSVPIKNVGDVVENIDRLAENAVSNLLSLPAIPGMIYSELHNDPIGGMARLLSFPMEVGSELLTAAQLNPYLQFKLAFGTEIEREVAREIIAEAQERFFANPLDPLLALGAGIHGVKIGKNIVKKLERARGRADVIAQANRVIDEPVVRPLPEERPVTDTIAEQGKPQILEAIREAELPPAEQLALDIEQPKGLLQDLTRERTLPEAQGETIGLSQARIEQLRNDVSLMNLPPHQKRGFAETADLAMREGHVTQATTNAQSVLASPHPLSTKQQVGILLRVGELKVDHGKRIIELELLIKEGKTREASLLEPGLEATIEELNTLTSGLHMARSQAGEGLGIGNILVDLETFDVAGIESRATIRKGEPLNRNEQSKFRGLSKEIERADKVIVKEEAGNAKFIEKELKREAELEVKRQAKATLRGEDLDKVKLSDDAIKKRLRKLGVQVNDITGVSAEGLYLLGRLATNHVRKGAVTLSEVVARMKKDVPQLSERDVYEAVNSRNPNVKKKIENKIAKQIRQVKSQSLLVNKLDDLAAKIPTEATELPVTAESVKGLRSLVKEIEREAKKEKVSASKIEKINKEIAKVRDFIDNAHRPLKKRKATYPNDAKVALEALRNVREEMRVNTKNFELEAQILSGVLDPKKVMPKKATSEGVRNERAINTELRKTVAKIRAEMYKVDYTPQQMQKLENKLIKVQDFLDGKHRPLRKPKKAFPEEVVNIKKEISDIEKLMKAKDRNADLQQQLDTGNFKTKPTPEKVRVSPELEEAWFRGNKLRRDVRVAIEDMRPFTRKDILPEFINLARTAQAMGEMSAVLRQGVIFALGRPIKNIQVLVNNIVPKVVPFLVLKEKKHVQKKQKEK